MIVVCGWCVVVRVKWLVRRCPPLDLANDAVRTWPWLCVHFFHFHFRLAGEHWSRCCLRTKNARNIRNSPRTERTRNSDPLKIALEGGLSNLIWVPVCSYAIRPEQNIRFVLIRCVYFWSSAAIAVGDDTHVIFNSIWLSFTVWLLFRYLFSFFFLYHVSGLYYCASQSLNEHCLRCCSLCPSLSSLFLNV